MDKPELTDTMRELLGDIAQNNTRLSVHGLNAVTAENALWEVGKPILDAVGVKPVLHQSYRWYLRDLSTAFRATRGKYLVFALEAVLVKWQKMQLDQEMLEMLIACCVDNLPAGEEADSPSAASPSSSASVHSTIGIRSSQIPAPATEPTAANSTFDIRHSELCAPEAQHA